MFYINPNYYGFSSTSYLLLTNFDSRCAGTELECYITSGEYTLAQFNFEDTNPAFHIMVCILLCVVCVYVCVVCVRLCVVLCMYLRVCVWMSVLCVCAHTRVDVYMHVCVRVWMCAGRWVRACIRVWMCIHVCVYTYAYMYVIVIHSCSIMYHYTTGATDNDHCLSTVSSICSLGKTHRL